MFVVVTVTMASDCVDHPVHEPGTGLELPVAELLPDQDVVETGPVVAVLAAMDVFPEVVVELPTPDVVVMKVVLEVLGGFELAVEDVLSPVVVILVSDVVMVVQVVLVGVVLDDIVFVNVVPVDVVPVDVVPVDVVPVDVVPVEALL